MTVYPARRAVVLSATACLLLAGCARGPSQAEVSAAVDEARRTVTDESSQLASEVLATNPDLTFTQESRATQPRSWDCSDNAAATGEMIQFSHTISYTVDPPAATAPLLDPIIDGLTADGWQVTKDTDDDQRVVDLRRDDYRVALSGLREPLDDGPAWVRVDTYSPCLVAPDPD
jgi:hypothetical protein